MCNTMMMAKRIIDAIDNNEVRNNLQYELDAYYKIKDDNEFYYNEYNSLISILNNTGFTIRIDDENHHTIKYNKGRFSDKLWANCPNFSRFKT